MPYRDENGYLYFRDVLFKMLKNHYGNFQPKSRAIQKLEKKIFKKTVAEMKETTNKKKIKLGHFNSVEDCLVRRYNHVIPFLCYKTSYNYLKTVSSKFIINMFNIELYHNLAIPNAFRNRKNSVNIYLDAC